VEPDVCLRAHEPLLAAQPNQAAGEVSTALSATGVRSRAERGEERFPTRLERSVC
jgi:hypothetical protein